MVPDPAIPRERGSVDKETSTTPSDLERRTPEVLIVIVGRKVGNALVVEGKEFHGHQSDPAE